MRMGIIGAGKVGIAMGRVMQQREIVVSAISDRLKQALVTAARYLGDSPLYTFDNGDVVRNCDIIAITTQDGVIRGVAEEIAGKMDRLDGKLFFHSSGAHSASVLSSLAEKGALLGAFHPLQTFPDIESAIEVLPKTYIFVEGTGEALEKLKYLGERIGYRAVTIEGEDKVLYHLSAVFVCNLLCALLYAGERVMKEINVEITPFFPIIRATLKNIEEKGPLLSLTGPLVRGDAGTIAAHIDAMKGMDSHKAVYKTLSLMALDMVEKRDVLSAAGIDEMRKLLETIKT
jgi:predicted short-subunit dehydrogenase-like oxidoreductase (DUF2520 family)